MNSDYLARGMICGVAIVVETQSPHPSQLWIAIFGIIALLNAVLLVIGMIKASR